MKTGVKARKAGREEGASLGTRQTLEEGPPGKGWGMRAHKKQDGGVVPRASPFSPGSTAAAIPLMAESKRSGLSHCPVKPQPLGLGPSSSRHGGKSWALGSRKLGALAALTSCELCVWTPSSRSISLSLSPPIYKMEIIMTLINILESWVST